MKEMIAKNFFVLIVIALLSVIILQQCGHNIVKLAENKIDTTITNNYRHIDSTIVIKPIETKYVRYDSTIRDTQYLPSTDIKALTKQFELLRDAFLAERQYRQEFKIDSIGTAVVEDTIKQNQIIGRSFNYHLSIPEKTTTITIIKTPPPKNKWFIGGGLAGNKVSLIHDANIGLGLLNKKEQLFEAKARTDFNGNVYYEVNTFWKIHF